MPATTPIPAAAPTAKFDPSALVATTIPTVLIVEDDDMIANLICKLLKRSGFNVIRAATGVEGLQLVRNLAPDIVVLDVELPEIGGLEICRRLKADPKTRALPVVFCSGQTHLAKQALGLGAAAFLSKPDSITNLGLCLRQILSTPVAKTINP